MRMKLNYESWSQSNQIRYFIPSAFRMTHNNIPLKLLKNAHTILIFRNSTDPFATWTAFTLQRYSSHDFLFSFHPYVFVSRSWRHKDSYWWRHDNLFMTSYRSVSLSISLLFFGNEMLLLSVISYHPNSLHTPMEISLCNPSVFHEW